MPNFMVIGAQKCATSSVCDLIGAHPEAFMTDPKEPYFFARPEAWAKGFEWYESLFEGAEGRQAIGEGSTVYTMAGLYPEAPQRIFDVLPDLRLIYIARNPLERIQSHYMHMATRRGRETRPFAQAIRESDEYIDNTLYRKQIDRYRALYPDEKILVLFYEDFKTDPGAVMRRVYRFLGINDSYVPADAGVARNVSARGRVDTFLLRPLRKIPGHGALYHSIPQRPREALRRVLKKPIPGRPAWDEASRRWAIGRLADDNRAFLERYGKPDGFWGIDWDDPAAG